MLICNYNIKMQEKSWFEFEIGQYPDRSWLHLSDGTIRIQNFHFSLKSWYKTVEYYQNCFVAEKRIISKLPLPN